jgi:hypothetical protein
MMNTCLLITAAAPAVLILGGLVLIEPMPAGGGLVLGLGLGALLAWYMGD